MRLGKMVCTRLASGFANKSCAVNLWHCAGEQIVLKYNVDVKKNS
jgi:hypothetical protein